MSKLEEILIKENRKFGGVFRVNRELRTNSTASIGDITNDIYIDIYELKQRGKSSDAIG